MAFEKTPPHLLTEHERELRDSLEAFDAKAEQFIDPEVGVEPTLNLPLANAESETPADEKEKELTEEEQRELALDEMVARPDILEVKAAFLQEIAGLSPFSKTYGIPGLLSVTFTNFDSETQELVNRQCVADLTQGRVRSRHPLEMQQASLSYRFSLAVSNLQITDPQSGRILKQYSAGFVPDEATTEHANSQCTAFDHAIRSKWLAMQKAFITTQTLHQKLFNWFGEFEQLQNDLIFILENRPDFFTNFSSPTGPAD